ncbi:hypothetical protein [Burkholderia alba]|uniref:hypothetical protein n=1 Tax=Burkholderia alba TaxID=2683677 RepID=UPI002B05D9C7|nr:hypothetical protein [Burkholderia alba]
MGDGDERGRRFERDVVREGLTLGGLRPIDDARRSLGAYDRAALAVLERHRELTVQAACEDASLTLYVNTLGRLHVRPSAAPRIAYTHDDTWLDLGHVAADAEVLEEIDARFAAWLRRDVACAAQVRATMNRAYASGELPRVLNGARACIKQIEPMCFYVEDRLHALADRYERVIGGVRGTICLTSLSERGYPDWSDDDRLIVAALYALKVAGRAAGFAAFNGSVLSASALIARLHALADECRSGGVLGLREPVDLFEWAGLIREQALLAAGKLWLRYRWADGLEFSRGGLPSRDGEGSSAPSDPARASPPVAWLRRVRRRVGALAGALRERRRRLS